MTGILEVPEVDAGPAPGRRASFRVHVVAWVLVLGLAGGLLGLAIGARIEPRAKAEVSLALNPLPGNAFSRRSEDPRRPRDRVHLPGSDAVLRRVAADGLGLATPGNDVLRRRLTVSVLPNTEVIVLHYRGSDPQVAAEMAKRIARATLAERVARAAAANAQRAEIVKARIDAIEAEVEVKADGLEADPTSDTLRQQIRLLSQESVALEAQLRAATAEVASPGEIIASSTHNDVMLKRLRLLVLAGCIAAGMLLGVWVARGSRRQDPAAAGTEDHALTT